MKLVILGAGASYDSYFWYRDQEVFKAWRPPLANEIFDTRPEFMNIIDSYPASQNIFNNFSTISDLEDYFQKRYELINKHNSVEDEAQFINIRFFLQHLFYTISDKLNAAGFSNYHKLVQLIHDYTVRTGEDVLIVNFNYDLLLENTLRKFYFNSASTKYDIRDYLGNKIKLVKPHGSCNWFRMFTNGAFRLRHGESLSDYFLSNKLTHEKIDKLLGKEFYVAPYNASMLPGSSNQMHYLFPQVFVPLKEKDDFCMPKEQIDYLMDYLPKVTDIMIIGWKGYEAHFNGILKEKIGDKRVGIDVINGPADYNPGIVIENLAKYINTSNNSIFSMSINPNMIKNTLEIKDAVYKYVDDGSLSSYFMNLENGNVKSIFS